MEREGGRRKGGREGERERQGAGREGELVRITPHHSTN